MKCQIAFSDVDEKYARVNFIHPKDSERGKKIVREAVAFPVQWVNGEKNDIPYPRFCSLLLPENDVDVVWSKKLGKYVVRF